MQDDVGQMVAPGPEPVERVINIVREHLQRPVKTELSSGAEPYVLGEELRRPGETFRAGVIDDERFVIPDELVLERIPVDGEPYHRYGRHHEYFYIPNEPEPELPRWLPLPR